MKKILYLVLTVLLCCSCSNFLERDPENDVSSDAFFNSENDLKLYTNSFINSLLDIDDFTYGDQYTDVVSTNSSTNYFRAGWNANQQGGWSWGDLRSINYMLDNMKKAKGKVSDVVYNHYEGVARFWRARFYYDMVKNFGGVPWYDRRDRHQAAVGHCQPVLQSTLRPWRSHQSQRRCLCLRRRTGRQGDGGRPQARGGGLRFLGRARGLQVAPEYQHEARGGPSGPLPAPGRAIQEADRSSKSKGTSFTRSERLRRMPSRRTRAVKASSGRSCSWRTSSRPTRPVAPTMTTCFRTGLSIYSLASLLTASSSPRVAREAMRLVPP